MKVHEANGLLVAKASSGLEDYYLVNTSRGWRAAPGSGVNTVVQKIASKHLVLLTLPEPVGSGVRRAC